MGWKNIRDHYRIKHIIQITDDGVCIGSPYCHDLIVVSPQGDVVKRDGGANLDLHRYLIEMDADPATLRRLIQTPDAFAASIPVYTYDGAEIIKERCEALGWPNVTHAGHIQFENMFSADRAQVVAWAKQTAEAALRFAREHLAETICELRQRRARRDKCAADVCALEERYPEAIEP